MIELSMIFVSGFLGSAHCVGMCGGFVLTIGSAAPTLRSNLARQLAYSCGRLFTYGFLGAVGGFAGHQLAHLASPALNLQAVLGIVAGLFLIGQGLVAAGVLPRLLAVTGTKTGCGNGCFSSLLTAQHWSYSFLSGLFTGFLPCGLVYAFFSLAVGSANMAWGIAIMLAFGLGTVPVLVLTGTSGNLIGRTWRRHAFTVAAWCVVLTGTVSFVRGASLLLSPEVPVCPLCE